MLRESLLIIRVPLDHLRISSVARKGVPWNLRPPPPATTTETSILTFSDVRRDPRHKAIHYRLEYMLPTIEDSHFSNTGSILYVASPHVGCYLMSDFYHNGISHLLCRIKPAYMYMYNLTIRKTACQHFDVYYNRFFYH